MARVRLLAALAAIVILSSGTAHAQRESEERALRDQLADRDEYRTKLLLELQRREALLAKQQQRLAEHDTLLQDMYAKLYLPPRDDEEDVQPGAAAPTPAATGPGGRKIPPDTAQTKKAKDFESQAYKTNLARYNVARTRKDIADIKALLARNP